MWLLKILNGFDRISIASGEELILPPRSTVGHYRKLLLNLIFIGTCCWVASAHAVDCQVQTKGGLGGASPDLKCGPTPPPPPSPPPPVVTTGANGAYPVESIVIATNLVNFINYEDICSTAVFTTQSLITACTADRNGLSTWIANWTAQFKAGTLTVAYDATVQDNLNAYEQNLAVVMALGGYNASAAPAAVRPLSSPAFEVGRDEIITPDDANAPECTQCSIQLNSNVATCGIHAAITTLLVLIPGTQEFAPVEGANTVACLISLKSDYDTCTAANCQAPIKPPPPQACPVL